MILPTVRHLIDTVPDIPFSQYYQQYIFDVQDQTIQYELDDLSNSNVINIARLIDSIYKEMIL